MAGTYTDALQDNAEDRRRCQEQLAELPKVDSDRLERLRSAIGSATSAWDAYEVLSLPEQRLLLQALFENLTLDNSGVVRYTLNTAPAFVLAA